MTDVRVESLPIAGLEYVFVPPGVPLVTKTAESPATTSILIRGGAGTGKTTLAVALAHAICRDQEGVTLYLTTEFVVTELAYKAKTLGLPDHSVDSWGSSEVHEPGTILAEHLLHTRAGASDERMMTVAARKRAAIDAVWELLADANGQPGGERPVGPPVRAVVIDAFGLPEVEQDDDQLRNELLGLVQSLELAGINVILVEEADGRAEAWLPFVVDVVFEIDLWPDPETGDLVRRLKCPKSRYSQGLPGPHDYGLDSSRIPAVWPDLVFANVAGVLWREDRLPPAIFIPLSDEEYVVCDAGSVLVSTYDQPTPIVGGFMSTPGLETACVNCGPLSFAALPGHRGDLIEVGESEGLLALGWGLIREFHAGRINSVFLSNLGFFLARPRLRVRALRTIAMLSEAGLSVCLSGESLELASAGAVADIVQNGKLVFSMRVRVPRLQPLRADRWLQAYGELSVGETPVDSPDCLAIKHMLEGRAPEDVRDQINKSPPPDHNDFNATLRRALTYHLLGLVSVAAQGLSWDPRNPPPALVKASYRFLIGDGVASARQRLPRVSDPDYAEVWLEFSAIYAQNPFALEALAKTASASHIRQTIAYMRALAAGADFDRFITFVDTCREWFNLPEWHAARLRAEYYLDSREPEDWRSAISGLSQLSEDATIPPIHRAEISYNLGVAKARLGDEPGAREAYQRAQEFNPLLDVASNA